jgi:hypothetical protein
MTFASPGEIGLGGGSRTSTQQAPCTPTQTQLANSGTVQYKFTEVTVLDGALGAIIHGNFTTSGGYSGTFSTSVVGAAAGLPGLSGSLGTGQSRNLATFSGANLNIVAQLGIGSVSENFLPGNLDRIGATNAISTPGLSAGATRSYTRLDNVQCPAGGGGW